MFFESNLRARQAHSVMQMHPLRGPYGSTASRTPRFRTAQAAIRISLDISERPRRQVTAAATASRRPVAAIVRDPVAGKDEIRSPSIVSYPKSGGTKRETPRDVGAVRYRP
jgi:hypothetical protein